MMILIVLVILGANGSAFVIVLGFLSCLFLYLFLWICMCVHGGVLPTLACAWLVGNRVCMGVVHDVVVLCAVAVPVV